ncbi:solute carrier family 30 (zinc transporter), member 2 [Nematocida major]|uniref:solute carrier family 30 (zinc transporter), member 2 n=1 Tax=Nematocida major TaxID=1912982 RepID=UPI002007673F|nr:solute carrier family 30 (zinc transporter), member 2 [Nematocida major]KAH9386519.1 solute carrier family 30 (zinc transporter), member 2 [Nematocida major]
MEKTNGVYIILFNTVLLLMVELVALKKSKAVSILGEVLHMAGDLLTVGVGLAASFISSKYTGGKRYTFGLARVEVLGAAVSLVLVWAPSVYLVYLSVGRYLNPKPISREVLLVTAFISLLINLVNFIISVRMQKRSGSDMSISSIYVHALTDLMQCMGLFVSGIALYIDPSLIVFDLLAACLSTIICFYGSLGLAKEIAMMFLDASPVDVESVRSRLLQVSSVKDVSDLRIWCTNRNSRMAMVGIDVFENASAKNALYECKEILAREYHIGTSCIEVRCE